MALLYPISRYPVNSRSPAAVADIDEEAMTRTKAKKKRPWEAKLEKHHYVRLANEDASRNKLKLIKQTVSDRA